MTEIKQPQSSAAIMTQKQRLFFPWYHTKRLVLLVGRRISVHTFYLLNVFNTFTAQQTRDMRRLTTGMRSEKCVVRRFRRCANVYLYKPRQYSLLHTYAIWYSLLFLGYKPVQHVTVLNTVGNCNTMVSIVILYYNITILWDHRRICGPSLTETSLWGAYL